jgi:hypothetical protein
MLRNKKYGMGGAVQSFSSPMLAQGMQCGLSGFGTSGLHTFAKGGEIENFAKKNIGKKVRVDFRKEQGIIVDAEGDFVYIKYPTLGFTEGVNVKLEPIYFVEDSKYAKGGEIIDQYEGRTPADIWFNLSKSQRRHLLLDHANIPSGEISMYVGYDTNYDDLPHFIKQIVKKHFAEGQYAKGGQIASIGDSGIITDKNSMFVGKMATITGDLGNMFEVRVGGRTTVVKKNGIRIISDEYADGGKTRKSGNVPKIAKKVAEVNALIEKGNELGLSVVDSSSTWQSPMKYKTIKYVNGILYIEYEELDLYSHLKRGINQWKLKKDKVLKRNMEFDNPLNDIAKMYRKAIREREQYFADGGETSNRNKEIAQTILNQIGGMNRLVAFTGAYNFVAINNGVSFRIKNPKANYIKITLNGKDLYDLEVGRIRGTDYKVVGEQSDLYNDMLKSEIEKFTGMYLSFAKGGDIENKDRFTSAKTMGRNSQNWEAKLKEYAGEHYKSLTPREREEIIADMQKSYDKNSHFAKGGKISSYEVELEAVPNSDFSYGSHESKVRVKKSKKSANSIEQAVAITKQFIQENDLGGSNFIPAKIYKNGKHIGFISYNGRVWNNDQTEMKYAQGGQIKPKKSRITLIMDGKSYSYPVAIVNGRVETTEETFKDGVVREYLDKEFDLWLKQAPTDYEEMYYGDEDVMSKSGAIEGAMEIVISTIEEESPKKTTFNFDEGDVEFYEAYQYARGGSIAVSDDEKKKSLKGNLKIKF